jgi:hypothetical protein
MDFEYQVIILYFVRIGFMQIGVWGETSQTPICIKPIIMKRPFGKGRVRLPCLLLRFFKRQEHLPPAPHSTLDKI